MLKNKTLSSSANNNLRKNIKQIQKHYARTFCKSCRFYKITPVYWLGNIIKKIKEI